MQSKIQIETEMKPRNISLMKSCIEIFLSRLPYFDLGWGPKSGLKCMILLNKMFKLKSGLNARSPLSNFIKIIMRLIII